eukprot:5043145-Prymnesium_polylepis.1
MLVVRLEVRPLSAEAMMSEPSICELRGKACGFAVGGAWLNYLERLGTVAACEADSNSTGGCRLSERYARQRAAMKVQALVSAAVVW